MKLLNTVINIFASNYGFSGVKNNPSIFSEKSLNSASVEVNSL